LLSNLPQIPEFGWHNCIPKDAGRRLKEHADGTNKYHLLECVAQAKRWIHEHIITYIDGKLPVFIRKFKFAYDVIKVMQYAARIVATAAFLQSLIRKEVALANAYLTDAQALLDFAEATLSPAGLRTQAELEMIRIWNIARNDIQMQINQNNESIQCLL
jgi:hypothetical protein